MKRKPKLSLIINISVICLCVCAIAIGVYSVKNASLSVSGTIGFNAHDCEMLIKGTMQGYQLDDNGINTTAVTKYFSSNNASDGTALTVKDGTNNSWSLGALVFDDLHTTGSKQVNDIIFTFEITNNSDFYVDVTVDQDFIGNDRIFVYAPNNGETLSPKSATDGSNSITLTVKLQLQKDADGNYSKLESAIDLSKAKSLLNFKKIDAPATLASDWGKIIWDGYGITDKFVDDEGVGHETLSNKVEILKFVDKIDNDALNGCIKNEDGTVKGVSVKSTNSLSDITAYINETTKTLWVYSPARIYVQNIDTTSWKSLMSPYFYVFYNDNNYDYNKATLTSIDLSNFDTTNVTDMGYMFMGYNNLKTFDTRNLDTTSVTNMEYMFMTFSGNDVDTLDVRNFDTSDVINMANMFRDMQSLITLDVSNFDTSNVTNMYGMFDSCYSLTTLDVSNFDTTNVTNMSSMFSSCSKLTTLDVSNFDTSNVTNMNGMFCYCEALTSLDVSGLNTSKVTNMGWMFSGLNVAIIDASNFDTSNVTSMCAMFKNCNRLTSVELSSFDTSNVTDMNSMFLTCSKLTTLNLSNFDTSNVTDVYEMFYNCESLTKIYVGSAWSTSKVSLSTRMFYGCTSLVGEGAYEESNKTDVSMANYTTGYLTLKTA